MAETIDWERKERMNLEQLSQLYGIAHEYYDIWGNHTAVSAQTKHTLLQAMGVAPTENATIDYQKKRWQRWLSPVQVVYQTETPHSNPRHTT